MATLMVVVSVHCETYNFTRIDNTMGLSNNQIESIFKDSRGFLWIDTSFGLNRYDGYEFKQYKTIKGDSTSIISNFTHGIQEDFKGNLWIRGQSSYAVYDVSSERFIRNQKGLLSRMNVYFTPDLVYIDAWKNFYFYQSQKGVFKYDVAKKQLSKLKVAIRKRASVIDQVIDIKSLKGSVWLLYSSGLLERFNESSGAIDFRNNYIADNGAGASFPKKLFVDSDGCPWVYPGIGDKGILCYDFRSPGWVYFGKGKSCGTDVKYKPITSDFIRSICEDKKKRIWIGTDHGGINVYDKTKDNFAVLINDPENPSSLSQNSAISMYCDENGIVWVGTYKNGVSYYHPQMFKFEKSPLFFFHDPLLENKDCNVLHEDAKGNLWIGTNSSGLLMLEKSSGEFRIFRNRKEDPASISSDVIISLLEDNAGNIWVGTFLGGVNLYNGGKFVHFIPQPNNPNSLSNKNVYGLVEDKNRHIWMGTLGGIDEYDVINKTFKHYNRQNNPGMSDNAALSLFSRDGALIYTSTPNGVDVIDTRQGSVSALFKTTETKNKLTDLIIYNSMMDSRGELWLATENGINIYNPARNKITYITLKSGLPSDQVVSFAEDNDGNVWAGTRNGLACIYVSRDKISGKESYRLVSFDENDGLPGSIFNQNAVFKNREGKLYFGTTKGYVVFDPKNIQFNKVPPVPRFTDLIIGNTVVEPGKKYNNRVILQQSISETQKLTLHHNEKNFTICFSAMNYIHPEKNRYKYMLKGFDDTWYETRDGSGSVSYSNLNQGTYELIVYASNNDNVWSAQPLKLQIIIRPPFWLAWWAIFLYIVFIGFIVWYILNYKLKKQQKEFENVQKIREAEQMHEVDEMKFRFFTNISHEFRTPLTLIINPIEKLLAESTDENKKTLLSIVQRNAYSLLELVNQLLDFRKLDVQKDTLNLSVGDIVLFVRDICYSFTDLANRKMIKFSFSTTVSELRMDFDSEKVKKIVYNLLSNAFKFTPDNGRIDVALTYVQQMNDNSKILRIVISDSGIGIPEKDIEHIFERFYRVEQINNEISHTGTGVGLHIVSEYVKMHKGSIHVESKVGQGSKFTILLPVNEQIHEEIIGRNKTMTVDQPEPTDEIVETSEESKEKLPQMMVVDDNADFRNFISSIFSDRFRILQADNGEAAYKIIMNKLPDIIVCDVMMPKMDGLELCRLIKKDIRVSHIPVILLTAKTGEENKYKGLEAGAEDYIAKPFNMEMLTLKVNRIIERQQKTHEQFRKKIDISPSEVEITSMDEKFVKKAIALVEANISNPDFLVENLCAEMGMSRVYFYKKILALTDKTPSEFIRFIRLKRAAALLEKSQLFVNEVAYQVGFNDPKYFRKYFKEEFGISPNDYKKKFVN